MPIPTLDTERLRLRPFSLSDATEVQRLAGDRAIADTTLNIPHPYEDGRAEAWIRTHEAGAQAGHALQLAVTRKADGRLIGSIALMGISLRHGRAEMGYWVGTPYWNQGFCTEAGRAVLEYAFEVLGLNRVQARHMSRNPSSGRVMVKLGMRHEGTLHQYARRWSELEDMEIYAILAEDWRASPDGTPTNPGSRRQDFLMRTVDLKTDEPELDFDGAKKAADALAEALRGEILCMAWYDRAEDRESPAHASECHGSCEVPGYVEYAVNRGADLKIVVNDGAFVFCYRPLGEFA